MEPVLLNNRGVTLVEVMVALVVLLFVSLALMQTALVSIDANTKNSIRDEAVSVAETRINEARNLTWDKVQTDTSPGDDYTLPTPDDQQECLCKTGEGCTGTGYDSGPYPVKVDRKIRNMTVSFGTRRVVTTVDATKREVGVVVRVVYKDKCYSHFSSTILRQPGT
ncbi:MAG: type II secretion system protein [Candidatus Sulfobium sp.]|jgi:prepilin-type N-terminal cleavage/methylation domain-containing protein